MFKTLNRTRAQRKVQVIVLYKKGGRERSARKNKRRRNRRVTWPLATRVQSLNNQEK